MSANEAGLGLGLLGIGAGIAGGGTLFGVAALGGVGLSAGSQIDAASAKSNAAQREAGLLNLQARELLEREAINEEIMRQQSELQQKDYGAAAAATGLGGEGIGGIVRMRANLETTIANSRRDAEFKARMLRAGAEIQGNLASDIYTSGLIGAGGTILTGVGNYAGYAASYGKPSSTTQDLPKV